MLLSHDETEALHCDLYRYRDGLFTGTSGMRQGTSEAINHLASEVMRIYNTRNDIGRKLTVTVLPPNCGRKYGALLTWISISVDV